MQNLTLRGLRNTRDLGGLPAAGGVVRPKLLLRGGHLHNVSLPTLQALANDYGVTLVMDLRTDMECSEKPDGSVPGAAFQHVPLLDAATVGITHEQESDDKMTLIARLPNIESLYRSITEGAGAERLSQAVKACMQEVVDGGTVLFHCTEGKDRTGVMALVLLSALGTPQQDIMRDYLFTNTVATGRARHYYWLVRLLKRDKSAAQKVRRLFMAEESYLRAAIDAMEGRCGSINAYTVDVLGISADLMEAFSHRAVCAN